MRIERAVTWRAGLLGQSLMLHCVRNELPPRVLALQPADTLVRDEAAHGVHDTAARAVAAQRASAAAHTLGLEDGEHKPEQLRGGQKLDNL